MKLKWKNIIGNACKAVSTSDSIDVVYKIDKDIRCYFLTKYIPEPQLIGGFETLKKAKRIAQEIEDR